MSFSIKRSLSITRWQQPDLDFSSSSLVIHLCTSSVWLVSFYSWSLVSQQIVPENLRPVLREPVYLEYNRKVHDNPESPAQAEPPLASSMRVKVALGRGRLFVLSLISAWSHRSVSTTLIKRWGPPPSGIHCLLVSNCIQWWAGIGKICALSPGLMVTNGSHFIFFFVTVAF